MKANISIIEKFLPCLETKKRYVHSYGGRGSSKSHHEGINFILKLAAKDYFRGVLVREVHDTIRSSQFQLLKDLITLYGLENDISINESRMSFTCSKTGNTIISKGLKKSSKNETAKFKSITGVTHVWIEEAEEINQDDFEKIDGSIREVDVDCQIRLTYNTGIEPDHWLRTTFHSPQREDTFYIHSTYHDNIKHLNDDYIETREQMKEREPERYAVEVMGEWGVKLVDSPFATQYDTNKHRKPCEYNPTLPVHLTLDFNLDPFAFLFRQMWRDEFGWHLHYFKEETIEGGTITEACNRIRQMFGNKLHTLTITGDYSGTHRQMSAPDKASLYQQLVRGLRIRKSQFHEKM